LCPTKHNFSSPTKTSIGSTNNTSPCIWNCRFFWDKSETLNEFWNVDTKHTLRIIQKKIKSQVQIISPVTMWCYTKNECCVLQLFFTKMFSPYTDGLSVYSYTTTPTSQNFFYHLLKIYLFFYSKKIFPSRYRTFLQIKLSCIFTKNISRSNSYRKVRCNISKAHSDQTYLADPHQKDMVIFFRLYLFQEKTFPLKGDNIHLLLFWIIKFETTWLYCKTNVFINGWCFCLKKCKMTCSEDSID